MKINGEILRTIEHPQDEGGAGEGKKVLSSLKNQLGNRAVLRGGGGKVTPPAYGHKF